MKKIIIAAFCIQLIGCASLKYPNWEHVTKLKSAYNQPCKEVGVDEGTIENFEYNDAWLKKRATIYGGNNFVVQPTKDNGLRAVYFYCSPEIPHYMRTSGSASVVTSTDKSSTKADYEKSLLKCNYEVHKATFSNETPNPTRVFIPTASIYLNQAQMSAIHSDNFNRDMAKIDSDLKTHQLLKECLAIAGFKRSESQELRDFEAVEKYCQAKNDFVEEYCFIPTEK